MSTETPGRNVPRDNEAWVHEILEALKKDKKTGSDIVNIGTVLVGEGFAITVSEKMGKRSMRR
jgi:hypothetical protein